MDVFESLGCRVGKIFCPALKWTLLLNWGATHMGLVGSQDCTTVVSSQTQSMQLCSGAWKAWGNKEEKVGERARKVQRTSPGFPH